MRILTIHRFGETDDMTPGVFTDENKVPFCVTGERVWFNNQPDVSCIPIGEYICQSHFSPKFQLNTFEVIGVTGRDNILFHSGNIPDVDSHGCILLGEQFGILVDNGKSRRAVLASGQALAEFLSMLKCEKQFRLIIVNV